jgi:acetone carboxylase gamma subunit
MTIYKKSLSRPIRNIAGRDTTEQQTENYTEQDIPVAILLFTGFRPFFCPNASCATHSILLAPRSRRP